MKPIPFGQFAPDQSLTGSAKLLYYARPDAMTEDEDTNEILGRWPGVYLFSCQIDLYRLLRNDNELAKVRQFYADALGAANRQTLVARTLGGPLRRKVGFGDTTGDVISVAYDDLSGLIWFRKNGGDWNNSGSADPEAGVGGFVMPVSGDVYAVAGGGDSNEAWTAAFAPDGWIYSAPSGFGAIVETGGG